MEEDKRVTLRVDKNLFDQLKGLSDSRDISMAEFIRNAVELYIRRRY